MTASCAPPGGGASQGLRAPAALSGERKAVERTVSSASCSRSGASSHRKWSDASHRGSACTRRRCSRPTFRRHRQRVPSPPRDPRQVIPPPPRRSLPAGAIPVQQRRETASSSRDCRLLLASGHAVRTCGVAQDHPFDRSRGGELMKEPQIPQQEQTGLWPTTDQLCNR